MKKLSRLMTSLEADVNDYGRVWFMKKALINIFSLFNMVKKYRVTFDSAVDNAFFVHKPSGLVRFGANDQGIYVMDQKPVSEKLIAKVASKLLPQKRVSFLQTVEENKKM